MLQGGSRRALTVSLLFSWLCPAPNLNFVLRLASCMVAKCPRWFQVSYLHMIPPAAEETSSQPPNGSLPTNFNWYNLCQSLGLTLTDLGLVHCPSPSHHYGWNGHQTFTGLGQGTPIPTAPHKKNKWEQWQGDRIDVCRGNWKIHQDLSFHKLLNSHLRFQPNWQCWAGVILYLLTNPKVGEKHCN